MELRAIVRSSALFPGPQPLILRILVGTSLTPSLPRQPQSSSQLTALTKIVPIGVVVQRKTTPVASVYRKKHFGSIRRDAVSVAYLPRRASGKHTSYPELDTSNWLTTATQTADFSGKVLKESEYGVSWPENLAK